MTARLEREGIFKAKPLSWSVYRADSGAVGINMGFLILAQLDGSEWVSWAEAEDHTCYGTFWIVKKDGTLVTKMVEDLYAALGWEGTLADIANPVPDRVVQITVRAEEYKGKTQYKAAFIAPEDYQPGPQGTDPAEVKQLDARFGSLLRAAAAGAKRAAGGKPAQAKAPPPATSSAPANPISGEPIDDLPALPFGRESTLRGLLEESIRAKVKQAASQIGVTLTKASDLETLDDARLKQLSDAVFDEAIPF